MPALKNPRHEAFAQALARGMSASAAYVEGGYKANRHNAAALAREEHIRTRVAELQEEQLAIHQQATAAAAANKQVTIESLIAEAEAARAKAMSEKGGAAAAVSALTAKAKLAGMWRGSELIDIPLVLLSRLGYDGLFAASAIFFKLLRAWENSDALKNPDRNCINCERHDCSNCYRRVALQ